MQVYNLVRTKLQIKINIYIYDDSCTEQIQTTDMNPSRNQSIVLPINYFRRSSMVDRAQNLWAENAPDSI